MGILSTHHGVDKPAVIGQQNQPLRVFVKPSRIGNTLRIIDLFHQNPLRMGIPLRTDHADRLIIGEHYLFIGHMHPLSPHFNAVTIVHLHAGLCPCPVYKNLPRPDQLIRIPSGTQTAGSQILIQSRLRHALPPSVRSVPPHLHPRFVPATFFPHRAQRGNCAIFHNSAHRDERRQR